MAVMRIGDRLKAIEGLSDELRFEFVVASYSEDSHRDMVKVFHNHESQLDNDTTTELRSLFSI